MCQFVPDQMTPGLRLRYVFQRPQAFKKLADRPYLDASRGRPMHAGAELYPVQKSYYSYI